MEVFPCPRKKFANSKYAKTYSLATAGLLIDRLSARKFQNFSRTVVDGTWTSVTLSGVKWTNIRFLAISCINIQSYLYEKWPKDVRENKKHYGRSNAEQISINRPYNLVYNLGVALPRASHISSTWSPSMRLTDYSFFLQHKKTWLYLFLLLLKIAIKFAID